MLVDVRNRYNLSPSDIEGKLTIERIKSRTYPRSINLLL